MLKLYKRQHTLDCVVHTLLAKGRLKKSGLSQYRNCPCIWWVSGVNDYGIKIPRTSTKASTWEAALHAIKSLNVPREALKKDVRLTLVYAFEQWVEVRLSSENAASDATIRNYKYAVRELIDFMAERKLVYLDQITADVLIDLRTLKLQECSRHTLNTRRGAIRSWLNYAVDRGWLERNPVAQTKPLAAPRRVRDGGKVESAKTLPLDIEAGEKNWHLVRDGCVEFLTNWEKRSSSGLTHYPQSFLALLELLYYTGMRISDALLFTPHLIEDTGYGGAYTFIQQKTELSCTSLLKPWLVAKLKALPLLSSKEGYVFYDRSRAEETYINSQVRYPMQEFGKHLGLTDRLRPHRFRDSCAINWLNAGVPVQDVQLMLGHRSLKTTEQHYLPYVKSRWQALEQRLYAAEERTEMERQKVIEMPARKVG